jgi:gas vesicle protein
MSRFQIGVVLGSAAVYFFDPQQGEDRRRRVQSFWRENRDTAREVGGGVSKAAESMRPLARRMRSGLQQRNWTEDARASWAPAVTGIAVATAFSAALAYFLDQKSGLVRRQRILTFLAGKQDAFEGGFRSVQGAAKYAVGEVSEAAENIMAMGHG